MLHDPTTQELWKHGTSGLLTIIQFVSPSVSHCDALQHSHRRLASQEVQPPSMPVGKVIDSGRRVFN